MSNDKQASKLHSENRNEKDSFEDRLNENRQLFKRALSEAMSSKISKIEEEIKDIEISPPRKRHKIQMNRFFRERVGGPFLPFPEEDSLYERVRSKIVIKLKINEFLDRFKERNQTK